jgi:hypothetical protein
VNWREIKRVYRSFCWEHGEKLAAQQVFHRMVWWLYELMPEKDARDFMMKIVDPDAETEDEG